jgi:environmental stress-induced protein Ves
MPWANGGGWTTEIVAFPDRDEWDWRVSVADIESGGPFSAFEGVARTIALVTGSGCVLSVAGQPDHVLDQPFVPFAFDGGSPTMCRLLDGPVQDLNLMQRAPSRRTLTFATVDSGHHIVVTTAEVLIVVAGGVELVGAAAGEVLDRLDAVLLDGPGTIEVRADGTAGVVAIVGPAAAFDEPAC